jgi:hypothetical protein
LFHFSRSIPPHTCEQEKELALKLGLYTRTQEKEEEKEKISSNACDNLSPVSPTMVKIATSEASFHFWAQNSLSFQDPSLPMALKMD